MQILSDFYKDTQTPAKPSGSYEWWYFDLLSEGGYAVVIIFYDGNPFSRRYISDMERGEAIPGDYPAISLSVYQNGKPLFYLFDECEPSEASFSKDIPGGNVKGSSFEGSEMSGLFNYRIRLNHTLPSGDSVRGSLTFTGKNRSAQGLMQDESHSDDHIWNLVSPRCTATGELEISGYRNHQIEIKGNGYHDHNVGFEPMKESFTEWYWGRYHLPKGTLVYYLMNELGEWKNKSWLIADDGQTRQLNTDFDTAHLQRNLFGLKSGRVFTFYDEETELYLQKDRLIDNGPFYQRFEGRLIAREGGKIEECRGISEYIYPSRIYNKLFWPLVNMRIGYPGREHWVQKSPFLYRWTW